MGLGTMLFPNQIIPLSFNTYQLDTNLVLTFRCFGAQASLVGLLLLSCKMTKRAYRNFGLAMLPFVAFDYIAWDRGVATTLGALGDLAGNVVFMTCCAIGYSKN